MLRPSFKSYLESSKMNIKDYLVETLLYNSFSCFLRRVGRFLLRLFRWIPVLWEQEEWDYEYIYDLLAMKMKELHKSMSKITGTTRKKSKEG